MVSPVSSSSPLILYVDDDEANRVIFDLTFKNAFNIITAESGKRALEILGNEKVSVLLTDQRMPGMTGNELLKQVKENHPEVIRIILTAYSQLDPILRAVNEGLVARYILKPWDKDELESMLRWAIEASKLGEEDSALQARLLQTERLVTLGSIAAAVFHDLNQPLAYFYNNCVRLQQFCEVLPTIEAMLSKNDIPSQHRELIQDLTEELPEIVSDMNSGCGLMQDLTHSLRKFVSQESTPEDGTEPYPIINYAMSLCRSAAIKSRGMITYRGVQELPAVKIGSTELTQILFNLINNAAQALDRESSERGIVTIDAQIQQDSIEFSIADTGVGMSADMISNFGKPFISTKQEGTGLGVTQCRRLIGKAGGVFSIDSTVGVGTTIRFSLPRAITAST
ncbi:MAG: hybrid sensor histidine kinase/response regulator [Myxococcota bacterium]|nr:hybrid sensor histidine kinase/response regulator [Myxococcota bacterium]